MNLIGIALVIIGLYLAMKVAGFVFKLLMCGLRAVRRCTGFSAPLFGWAAAV